MSTQTIAGQSPPQSDEVIVARAGRYYRVTRYIMTALLIGMGGWFAYDGFIGYPAHNERVAELEQERAVARQAGDSEREAQLSRELIDTGAPKSGMDIFLQKLLAFTLPPLGLLLLGWTLYNSRGEYRLENGVLHVPGHPPVPMERIVAIDKQLWDRKGIAYVAYDHPEAGDTGRIRLDDFVYERPPTDAIVERIDQHLGAAPAAEEAAAAPDDREPPAP
jgi:hypothetical protein